MTPVSSSTVIVSCKGQVSRYVKVMMSDSVKRVEVAGGCSAFQPGQQLVTRIVIPIATVEICD